MGEREGVQAEGKDESWNRGEGKEVSAVATRRVDVGGDLHGTEAGGGGSGGWTEMGDLGSGA